MYAPFWRSFWHVLGYSETELFGPRLLELPRVALGGPGEPQEPFWLHFGCIFGAILGPESKKGEKVKIELSPGRELNFGGPGRPRKRRKIDLVWQPSSGRVPGPLREALWRLQERKWVPRGSPGGGLLDTFSGFLGVRFRGRFWVIPLMTRGGLGEPPGSLNLRGSATNLTRQRSPSRGAANPVGFA